MMTSSSRGKHKRARQLRMDLLSTFQPPPNIPKERIKNDIITLFDSDFPVTGKAIKDWIVESVSAQTSYFGRKSKQEEIKKKGLTFEDGIKHMRNMLLAELLVDEGKELEEVIMEDLVPLIAEYCAECKAKA